MANPIPFNLTSVRFFFIIKNVIKALFFITLLFISYYAQAQLNSNDEDPERVFSKAEHLRKTHNYIGAINEYDRAILFDPNNAKYYYFRGVTFMGLKDYDNATLSFIITSKLQENYTEAYVMLAKCYEKNDRKFKREQALNLAFRFEEDYNKKMKYKVDVVSSLFNRNQFENALVNIKEAELINPENVNVLYYKGAILNKNRKYIEAKTNILKAVKQLPHNILHHEAAKYYYELGYAYNKLGEYDKQAKAFRKANHGKYKALIARMSPRYYVGTAMSYLKINDYDKSNALLDTALKMRNNYSYALVLKAKIAQKLADQSVAIDLYTQAISVEKNTKKLANIYRVLAQLQLDNNRYIEAVATSGDFLRIQPENYNIAFIKSIALFKLNKHKESIEVMENLVSLPHLDKEAKAKFSFALGLMYKSTNDLRGAEIMFKKAVHGSFKTVATIELEELPKDEIAKTQ